jgi:hypothetical protein
MAIRRGLLQMNDSTQVAFLFNGDADGILSQHMLWLQGLRPALRITGMKREIELLERLPATFRGHAYVLDISLKSNAKAAHDFLKRGVGPLFWYDHHESVEMPAGPNFEAHIHPTAGQCTAMIVNGVFGHAYDLWAAAAAFGDNVTASAEALLKRQSASDSVRHALAEMGELMNYNAYGEPEDAFISPLDFALRLEGFQNPLTFFQESGIFSDLARQMQEDQSHCQSLEPWQKRGQAAVYRVPDAPWARRFGATWMNRLIRQNPDQAFAIFQARREGGYLVSLRAPHLGRFSTWNAAQFASQFPTGGGRMQAAGINALPENQLEACALAFLDQLSG